MCRSFTPPPWVELGVGYGITDAFELLVDLRFGLGDDLEPELSTDDAPKQFVISPGIRVFIDDAGSLKFFTTLQLAIDRTDYSRNVVGKETDFGVRNVNGLLIDLHRTFGVYVHVGETDQLRPLAALRDRRRSGMMVRIP